jgi:ADP-ribose pyrophosphatase
MKEKLLRENNVYFGKILNLYVDDIILPNKKIATREYIRQPDAVAVIPFIDNKRIVLVKQYRYPIKKITYELPAGKISPKEKPIDCIKRELEEETGFVSNDITKLISFHPSTAFSTEILHIFIAKNLKKTKSHPDEDEFVKPEIIDYKKTLKWIDEGKISDSKTLIGLLYYFKKALS